MGYQHIKNLYQNQNVLLFKECYALEKIHGTSAHVRWKDGRAVFHPGGERLDSFMRAFDEPAVAAAFAALGHDVICVYGEAYGGKCQGMGDVYGPVLKFVAWLDARRDADSVQAVRNGMGSGKYSEGVVIRPLVEVQFNKSRIVAKHKRDDFRETLHSRSVEKAQIEVDTSNRADGIALEWMTDERLRHVIDRLRSDLGLGDAALTIENTSDVVRRSIADVQRESDGLVPWVPEVRRAVGGRAATMFKNQLKAQIGK